MNEPNYKEWKKCSYNNLPPHLQCKVLAKLNNGELKILTYHRNIGSEPYWSPYFLDEKTNEKYHPLNDLTNIMVTEYMIIDVIV